MNRDDLKKNYFWILKHLSETEKKMIETKNKRLLSASDREPGIHLDAKISGIMRIVVAPNE